MKQPGPFPLHPLPSSSTGHFHVRIITWNRRLLSLHGIPLSGCPRCRASIHIVPSDMDVTGPPHVSSHMRDTLCTGSRQLFNMRNRSFLPIPSLSASPDSFLHYLFRIGSFLQETRSLSLMLILREIPYPFNGNTAFLVSLVFWWYQLTTGWRFCQDIFYIF